MSESYKLITMVQESYGLNARCVVHAFTQTQLSTPLSRAVSERAFAYVRGARRFYGRAIEPASGLPLPFTAMNITYT
eukprot:8116-Heterococcus_DN1.PRE.2